MNKDELQGLLQSEWKKGFIVYQDFEGLKKCEITEFTKQPLAGQLYDINRDNATCIALINEGGWVNNFACARLVEYYYNKCQELESKLKEYDEQEAQGLEERR